MKRFGSAKTFANSSESGLLLVIGMFGYSPPDKSPTNNVSPPVGAKYTATGVRISEIEPAFDPLAGVVGVSIEIHVIREGAAVVREEFKVILYNGLSPDLRRISHIIIASCF